VRLPPAKLLSRLKNGGRCVRSPESRLDTSAGRSVRFLVRSVRARTFSGFCYRRRSACATPWSIWPIKLRSSRVSLRQLRAGGVTIYTMV